MPPLGEKKSKKPSENRKKMTARLMAVQAIYESGHNGEPLEQVLRDYLDNRSGMETDDGTLETPDRELFLQIAYGRTQSAFSEGGLPIGAVYQEVINSDWTIYGGSGVANPNPIHAEALPWQNCEYSAPIRLPPLGTLVFKPMRQDRE